MEGYKCSLLCLLVYALFGYGTCQRAEVNVCRSALQLPCDDGQCISRDEWCDRDGHLNCRDGSDEKYCDTKGWFGSPSHTCTEKHFACENGPCIPAVAKCDNFDDCTDYSDERQCEEEVITTESFSTTFRQEEDERSFQSVPTPNTPTDYYDQKVIAQSVDQNLQTPYLPPNYYGGNGQVNNRNPQNPYPYNQQNLHQNNRPHARPLPHQGNSTAARNTQRPNYNYQNPNQHTGAAGQPSANNDNSVPRRRQRQNFNQRNPQDYNRDPNAVSPRNGRDSNSADPNSQVQRQQPVAIQPRWVQYPPISREPYYTRKDTTLSLPSFYFAKNFTEQNGDKYENNVERAKAWLMDKRDKSYGWGRDTPRALVALSLINNRFTSDIADNDFMKKGLQTHLGIKLLRNKTEPLTNSRLAMYINALLATCQNPQDFLGLNLVDQLYNRRNVLKPLQTAVNPFVYLTLCLSGIAVDQNGIQKLQSLTVSTFPDDIAKDRHILATTALACFLQQAPRNRDLQRIVYDAVASLLGQKQYDGTFGNIYSTAIAAQALMSVNSTSWDPRPTLNYLADNQLNDGSFGDMLSTYYIIPVLSGRSLLHLRNTQCEKTVVSKTFSPDVILNAPGNKKVIFYSLKVGHPETFSISMQLTVPERTNFFDIMRVAQHQDPRYKFDYKTIDDRIEVYTIANVPNDPERGLYWNLYELRHEDTAVDLRHRSTRDVKELIPAHYEELLFWYLPIV